LIFGGHPEIQLADRKTAGEVSTRFGKFLNLRRESICAGGAGAVARAENKFINQ
jgi:hypothetical protein